MEYRREMLSNLYMTLKGEGCRFLEKLEDGRYKEKDIVSGKKLSTGECYTCVKKTKGML